MSATKQKSEQSVRTSEAVRKAAEAVLEKMRKYNSWEKDGIAAAMAEHARLIEEAEVLDRAAKAPAAAGLPARKFELVKVALIETDGDNHRVEGLVGRAETLQLAESIRVLGLQQPLGLMRKKNKAGKPHYVVIWGHRRFAAIKALPDEKTVPAYVYPELTDEQLHALRATENLQRADLNPIEEAGAVARLLDEAMEGDDKAPVGLSSEDGYDAAVTRVAEMLGKSERWVRDRAYLARLTGDARQLVLDGRLPLAQAREVAKVGDPKERDRIAHLAARREDGTGGMTVAEVRRDCDAYQRFLFNAPWKLDKAFGGCPACATCPFNSTNDTKLFEGPGDQAPEKAMCLKGSCFEKKQAAAQKLIEATVKKAKAMKAKADAPLTENTMGEIIPDAIKPASAVRRAKKELEPEKAKPKTPKVREQTWDEKRRDYGNQLHDEYGKIRSEWAKGAFARLCDVAKGAKPELLVALILAEWADAWTQVSGYQSDAQARKVLNSDLFKALFKLFKNPTWAAIGKFAGVYEPYESFNHAHPLVRVAALEALGAAKDLPELPDAEKWFAAKVKEWEKANPKPDAKADAKAKKEDEPEVPEAEQDVEADLEGEDE